MNPAKFLIKDYRKTSDATVIQVVSFHNLFTFEKDSEQKRDCNA